MQDALYNQTIALAGVAQVAWLVKDLAQSGKIDEAAYETSIYSIFQTDPATATAVYGDAKKIAFGLEKLALMLESGSDLIQIRYLLAIIRLQKKVSGASKTLAQLEQRLQQCKKQVEYFSLLHPTVINNLADIYLKTISSFNFRIVIWGNQRILGAPDNMEKIRALLLAGIRSAVLWRQMGGSRLQLIFSRAKIRAMAKNILKELS